MILKTVLDAKTQVPVGDRPVGMRGATWCWRACGGFMAVWYLSEPRMYVAAVNWDGKTTIPGVIELDDESGWVVRLNKDKASEADTYGWFDLDGYEA